jgi:thiamine biosynthesis lipoprotein
MLTRRELLKFSGNQRAAPGGYWLHLSRPAMACRFEITLPMSDQAGVEVARDALAEADKLEAQLSIFKDSSEVSRINRTAASGPVTVEPTLFALLLRCRQLARETAGAFDITSTPLSDCWGFLRRQGRIPQAHEIAAAQALVGSAGWALDRQSRTIHFKRPGVKINLGSIGKGYALDRIARLINRRVRACLLSAGASSIRAIGGGDRQQSGWVVGVRHPRQPHRRMAVLRLRDCAMATSGGEEQFFEYEGKRYGHVIDPRSGGPAGRVTSVTVIAPSAALADALATAFFVGGPEMAESYCAAHAGVSALMLESTAERPLAFGRNPQCEVEIGE